LRATQETLDSGRTKEYGNGVNEQSAFRSGNSRNSYGAHGNAGRTSEEGRNIFIEALRREFECRACEKPIRCKQIRRRIVTSFLTWRPSSETDFAALGRGWDDGAPRLVPLPATRRAPRPPSPPVSHRIGIALVPRGNATALSVSGTHGSSGEEATDIQSICPPPDARLAETIMIPAGHGHEHQGTSPAATPERSLDRDATTESILASPAHRS
jgi:hypothetical protein